MLITGMIATPLTLGLLVFVKLELFTRSHDLSYLLLEECNKEVLGRLVATVSIDDLVVKLLLGDEAPVGEPQRLLELLWGDHRLLHVLLQVFG